MLSTNCVSYFFLCTMQMCQTPLHVAAGYNNTEIVKFLLDWQGQGADRVEVEAKNMYGETPLHMAVKNSSYESAKLLLERGVHTGAKANNGMSPLHLAVWHALQTGDCSTVNLLLSYNADCNAKDDEGKIPLNHIPGGAGNEMLLQLLTRHMEEQRKQKALMTCHEQQSMAEFEEAISQIVGLQELKMQLRRWARGMLFDEKRRAMGLGIATRRAPHMAFLGNPGTGIGGGFGGRSRITRRAQGEMGKTQEENTLLEKIHTQVLKSQVKVVHHKHSTTMESKDN
ncbi:unnamed protein product [Triticum turgidum subsp. durum]|uniref:Uncharacterized protein n=1 Tax=Triticum turgidum subsp. durum TaxID=4567 RepID=A0A9R0YMU5_TRITD|nr:unnamed protein product [Triticum turgidum subsp. durum]